MEWVALKSGWLYERKPGLVIGKRWTPRWVVIYGEPVPALGIYEQRSDATPPYAPLRHLDLTLETKVTGEGVTSNGMLGWLRGRRDSMAEVRLEEDRRKDSIFSASRVRLEDRREDCVFTVTIGKGAVKLCFAARNKVERDEWIGAIKGVMITSTIESNTVIPVVTTSRVETNTNQYDGETISCAGVVVLDGRVVARIKAGNGSSNPLTTRSSSSSTDSIVGDVNQSLAVISDPHEERTLP